MGVGGGREEGEMVHQVGVVYVERSHVAVVVEGRGESVVVAGEGGVSWPLSTVGKLAAAESPVER